MGSAQARAASTAGPVKRGTRRDVEDLITDGDTESRRLSCRRSKNAERQILNWKVAAGRVGAFDKTFARWIVGFVERNRHGWNLAWRTSMDGLIFRVGADGVIALEKVGIHALQSIAQRYAWRASRAR